MPSYSRGEFAFSADGLSWYHSMPENGLIWYRHNLGRRDELIPLCSRGGSRVGTTPFQVDGRLRLQTRNPNTCSVCVCGPL